MAGLPKSVLVRAKEISKLLESQNLKFDLSLSQEEGEEKDSSKLKDEIFDAVKDLDPNQISPLKALEILSDLAQKIKEEK